MLHKIFALLVTVFFIGTLLSLAVLCGGFAIMPALGYGPSIVVPAMMNVTYAIFFFLSLFTLFFWLAYIAEPKEENSLIISCH